MKTLTQHIEESLNNKSIKEVSREKLVDEDLSNLMRTTPSKQGGIMKGTLKHDDKSKN